MGCVIHGVLPFQAVVDGAEDGGEGADVPHEMQFLLVESKAIDGSGGNTFVVFLPLVEGTIWASLQGSGAGDDELQFCIERMTRSR
uniref:Uncharacterized protein n=1 Tax=Oryza punctata TaxID=4537 RepID=A0A0E0LTJ8_ORYPU